MSGEVVGSQAVGWTDRLALDVALHRAGGGMGVGAILSQHGLSRGDLVRLSKDSLFVARVGQLLDQIRDEGVLFRLKARAQAEDMLDEAWRMFHDSSVSDRVKVEIMDRMARWGALEGGGESSGVVVGCPYNNGMFRLGPALWAG